MSAQYLLSIRNALRLTSQVFDGELKDLISAAKSDLLLCGISQSRIDDENDALIKRAITLYVRAEFNLEPEYADNYRNAYKNLKMSLMLSADYTEDNENA